MSKSNSERPPDSDFQQQNLKAWQPLLTPGWVIATFFTISVIFIPIGAIVMNASSSVFVQELRYDDKCSFDPSSIAANANQTCYYDLKITIDNDMTAPIFFYYKLSNFYQNHRRYVKSRDDKQLRGEATIDSELKSCDPLSQFGGEKLYPCGLIANSFFNDTFDSTPPSVTRGGNAQNFTWTGKGIAWQSDIDAKFKALSEKDAAAFTRRGPGGFTLPDVTNEDFIVWMRTAGLPEFKKLNKIIKTDLKKGDVLSIRILNAFPVAGFKGEKAIVLSTTSWLGGKNDFLAYAYVVVGALCFLLGLLFLLKHCFYERPLGDMHYFNWHANREGK